MACRQAKSCIAHHFALDCSAALSRVGAGGHGDQLLLLARYRQSPPVAVPGGAAAVCGCALHAVAAASAGACLSQCSDEASLRARRSPGLRVLPFPGRRDREADLDMGVLPWARSNSPVSDINVGVAIRFFLEAHQQGNTFPAMYAGPDRKSVVWGKS